MDVCDITECRGSPGRALTRLHREHLAVGLVTIVTTAFRIGAPQLSLPR